PAARCPYYYRSHSVRANLLTNRRNARVVVNLALTDPLLELLRVQVLLDVVGIGDHRAQLEDVQRPATIANALLAIDRRARGLQSDDQAEQRDRNQADDNHAQREGDVEGALHEAVAQAP